MDGNRRSACERCRGQKLRCVGLSSPNTLHRRGSFVRNEIPCDRCRKAQVECLSIRLGALRKRQDLTVSPLIDHRIRQPPVSAAGSRHEPAPEDLASQLGNSVPCSPPCPATEEDVWGPASFMSSQMWAVGAHNGLPNELFDTHLSPTKEACPDMVSGSVIDVSSQSVVTGQDGSVLVENYSMHELTSSNAASAPASTSASTSCHDDPFRPSLSSITPGCASPSASAPSPHSCPESGSKSACKGLRELANLGWKLAHDRAKQDCSQSAPGNRQTPAPNDSTEAAHPVSLKSTLRRSLQLLDVLQDLQQQKREGCLTSNTHRIRAERVDDTAIASDTSNSARPSASVDTSTLLLILSCYTHILKDFELLLQTILQSVSQEVPHIPSIPSGTTLGGLSLDGNSELQMEMILYFSSSILDKIDERLLGAMDENQPQGGQDLLGSGMAACLEVLYQPNTLFNGHENGQRMSRAKVLVREIQSKLKNLA